MLVKEFGRKGELANQAFGAGPNRAFCKPPVISGSLLLKVKASQANRRFRAPEGPLASACSLALQLRDGSIKQPVSLERA